MAKRWEMDYPISITLGAKMWGSKWWLEYPNIIPLPPRSPRLLDYFWKVCVGVCVYVSVWVGVCMRALGGVGGSNRIKGRNDDLVIRVLDPQSRDLRFKTTG